MGFKEDLDIIYDSVSDKLISCIPELAASYRAMLQWWGEEKPGPHVVYGELLNPFIDRLVEQDDDRSLARVFEFIEILARSNDAQVRDLVATTICEHIVSNPKTLRRTQMLMGSSTRAQCQEVMNFRVS
jgi:hypothetical protein